MIITIDGPAGVGKSSVAREVARRLGFHYLDTGAMYRAVTWLALQNGVDPADAAGVERLAKEMEYSTDGDRVLVDGQDVTTKIREPEVTRAVSIVADHPGVREHLVRLQREIASNGDYVCEGRDQGSVVFPDAELKIFLTASPEERAKRRWLQLLDNGISVSYEQVLKEQVERDQRDASRPVGALRKAPDAIEVVTDGKSFDEVVEELVRLAQQSMKR